MARDILFHWRWNRNSRIFQDVEKLGKNNPYIKKFPNIFAPKSCMFFGPDSESTDEYNDRLNASYAERDATLKEEAPYLQAAENKNYKNIVEFDRKLFKENIVKRFPKGSREFNYVNEAVAKIYSPFCNCLRRGLEVDLDKLVKLFNDPADKHKPFRETKFCQAIDLLKDQMLVADTCAMAMWKYKGIDPNSKNAYSLIQPVFQACQTARRMTSEERERWTLLNTKFANTKSRNFTYDTYRNFLDDCRDFSSPPTASHGRSGR